MAKDSVFRFSHTKLFSFRRCRLQYHHKYMEGYFPKSSIGQDRGTAGHAALAVWHSSFNAEEALQAAWDRWSAMGHEHNDDWNLLEHALQRYFVYSQEHDSWELLQSELEFNIAYNVPEAVLFNGYIDGIVREKGRVWLLENKFWKKVDDSYLDMDSQVSAYLLAANVLNFAPEGVIYNIVRIGESKQEPVIRRRIHRNLAGLQAIENEMLTQVREMIAYHKGGQPYRNPTKDCHWDCSFYQACLFLTDDGHEDKQLLESLSQVQRERIDEPRT